MNAADLRAALARRMPEDELLAGVRRLAHDLGYQTYHPLRSKGSEPGWPDCVIAGRGRCIFAELKSSQGRVTPAQRVWLGLLAAAGLDVRVWRPSDLLDGTILADLRMPPGPRDPDCRELALTIGDRT